MKIIKYFLASIWIAIILIINVNQYYRPKFINQQNQEVKKQLHYLHQEIFYNNGAEKMQSYFPEGYLFTNCLYAISVCEVAKKCNNQLEKDSILLVMDTCLFQIGNHNAKKIFNDNLTPQYGMFYAGWSNYVLQKRLELTPNDDSSILFKEYIGNCENIINAFDREGNVYLESYQNQIWPADNIVALASLHFYQKINLKKYKDFMKIWLNKAKVIVDPTLKCIPHKVSINKNTIIESCRGSSLALINYFLPEVDSIWAEENYSKFKSNFFEKRFGLLGCLEYPKGIIGKGDIDSGPIFLGIGASASITATKAALVSHDTTNYLKLRNNIESFGFAWHNKNEKFYLGGNLLVADAFIAWVNCTASSQHSFKQSSAFQFHFYSIIILLLPFIVSIIFKKIKLNFSKI
jgi:hypothetical protein